MEHLAEVDPDHVVVMVQVENEVGLLRDSRDRSPAAEAAWQRPVPQALIDHLVEHAGASSGPSWRRSGPGRATGRRARGRRSSATTGRPTRSSWPGAFASYCGALAAAGKAVEAAADVRERLARPAAGAAAGRRLPERRPRRPGASTSGRPRRRPSTSSHPTSTSTTPSRCSRDYDRPDNPVFVPESRFAVGRMFWALGHHRALGLLGVRRRPRPPRRPARPRVRAARRDGGRRHGRPGRGTDRRRPARRRRDRAARSPLGGYDVVARNARALLGRMLLDAGVGEPPPPPPPPSETDGQSARPVARPTSGRSAS